MLKKYDKLLLTIIGVFLIVGILVFISASLGVLVKNSDKFKSIAFNQIVFGLIGGITVMFIVSRIHFDFWRKYSIYILIFCICLTGLVYVPGIGISHAGARRWIGIGNFSLQPVEILKVAFILYFSSFLAWRNKNKNLPLISYLPMAILTVATFLVIGLQPDTKNSILLFGTALSMFFVSGAKIKNILIIFLSGIVIFAIIVIARPYVFERVKTFINPASDPLGSSYQLNQGLIAVGSGGMFGRGYGKSVQKFGYLPEPQGDSIFAVLAEEFGFVGSSILIFMYILFVVKCYKISTNHNDNFARYYIFGLTTLIIFQSFLNIVSVLGLFPLTGVPLIFISQGGTSLLFTLGSLGIILGMSAQNKVKISK